MPDHPYKDRAEHLNQKWTSIVWEYLKKMPENIFLLSENIINIMLNLKYVDDTLLLLTPEDVDDILARFNRFHDNITVDEFENCVPHFLALEIHQDGISIYRKS